MTLTIGNPLFAHVAFAAGLDVTVLTLGRDRFIGRNTDEVIFGDTDGILQAQAQGGKDYILTLGGNDVVFGDAEELTDVARGGHDRIRLWDSGLVYGDAFVIGAIAQGGNDVIWGGRSDDELYGDARLLLATSRGGHDRLRARQGEDTVYGDALFLEDFAMGGNDNLSGGAGDDVVVGDGLFLLGQAQGGDDVVKGDRGNDQVMGDAAELLDRAQGGDDWVIGGQGNDHLYGDAMNMAATASGGDDILLGIELLNCHPGKGELDTLTGNGGRDRFVLGDNYRAYYVGEGIDDHAILTDFSLADQDLIQLHGTAADYELQNFDLGTVSGVSIFLQGTDEMIGAVLNLTADALTLDSSAFQFVG